ncbi:MAG: 50S ribosomal protein L10 [Planctomycetes bacterium]|nr:50S ribosomal protein L10 [Planctomycetota bacterium]
MSRLIKDMVTKELGARYGGLDTALWVEFMGVDGLTTTAFRKKLAAKKVRMELVKTALFKRAMSGTKLAKLGDAACGQVALLSGGESLIDVAKLIDAEKANIKGLKMRAAILEGEFIGESQIDQLSKMPTKRDLQGRVAACALSPGAKLASAILAGGGNIAGCLKAMIEKLEKGEAIAAESA